MINITTSSRYKINRKKIKETFNIDGVINIIFVGKNKMRLIAKKYKKENLALPVLSFNYDESTIDKNEKLLGEVFICYPQAVLLSAERNKKVDDTILNLIKHGIENIIN